MIEINDLKDNTFFAMIHLLKNANAIKVDSRPSDAIALALRANAPIFVDEKVIDKSRSLDIAKKAVGVDEIKKEKLKDFLENLSQEDFGKYKM
jgi:bifunctional DNase/RNase